MSFNFGAANVNLGAAATNTGGGFGFGAATRYNETADRATLAVQFYFKCVAVANFNVYCQHVSLLKKQYN